MKSNRKKERKKEKKHHHVWVVFCIQPLPELNLAWNRFQIPCWIDIQNYITQGHVANNYNQVWAIVGGLPYSHSQKLVNGPEKLVGKHK